MKHFLVSLVVTAFFVSNGLNANTLFSTDKTTPSGDKSKLATLQIPFVKNVGQANADVAFYADTFGGALQVKKQGVLELVIPQIGGNETRYSVIGETFAGARIKTITGASPSPTRVSYFLGNKPENWHSNIPTFEMISLGDIYDGIELKLKAYGNNVEKLFHISPGADPRSIHVRISGIESLNMTEQGSLALKTKHGIIEFSRPRAYQVINNETRQVEVAYRVAGNTYSFELGEYDISKELVIDPLLQSSYFGGAGNDVIRALGIAPNDNVYVVGDTDSVISVTPDGIDAFVALYSPALAQLQNVSFIGGTDGGADYATAIAFRSLTADEFEVYIAGNTASADLAGLLLGGADADFGTASTGETEGFVARFNLDLTSLLGTSYYGGSAAAAGVSSPDDTVNSITITDSIYIAGTTSCDDIPHIAASSAQNAYAGGLSDGFIAKLGFDLKNITAATYLGGITTDEARDLVVDTAVYIAGNTDSADFRGAAGSPAGGSDAFVTRIDVSLTGTISSAYIGGSGDEDVQALVNTGSTNNALLYLAGTTTSVDFPLGTAAAVFPGPEDNFIAHINKDLAAEYQATYLGGDGVDRLWDMALHKEAGTFDINTDSVYVTGSTRSTVFPGSAQGEQEFIVGAEDAFIMRIDATLTDAASYQMTYLGGTESNAEFGYALAVDAINGVYVGGVTSATDFPVTTGGAVTVYSGGGDGFISHHGLSLQYLAEIRVSPNILPIDFGDILAGVVSSEELITIINTAADNDLIISSIVLSDTANYLLKVDTLVSFCGNPAVNYVLKPGENCSITVQFRPQSGSADPYNASVTISSNDFDEAEVAVTLTGTGSTDSDGVPDREESGPSGNDAGYDGNGDGIADRVQASAASLHSQNDAFYVTIAATDSNLMLENVVSISAPADLPENIQAPFGFYSYALAGMPAGGSATVTFTLNATGSQTLTGDEQPDGFWKYGPQPADPAAASWYDFDFDSATGTGAAVDLNMVTLSLTDGLRGDDDLAANGKIIDPGAPVKVKAVIVAPAVDDGSSGLCFIATAAYGSYMHDDVKVLRDFRDDYLLTNSPGRKFVSAYYQYSPPIADYIRADETRRMAARWLLTPLVYSIKHPYIALLLVLAAGLMVVVYRQRVKTNQVE